LSSPLHFPPKDDAARVEGPGACLLREREREREK
jgi:hypothetical protein